MTALVIRADARQLPLPDASVDLIVTSPPYFALRSYTDGGEHYAGQIGSEATPAEYIAALIACTREWMRVLKPTGSLFVNLGDKYSTRADASAGMSRRGDRARVVQPVRSTTASAPRKSLLMLPERYRIACVDQLGLTARAVIVWDKPNGLPESVKDRVQHTHEDWVHLTSGPHYFANIDAVREQHPGRGLTDMARGLGYRRTTIGDGTCGDRTTGTRGTARTAHPLGRVPGSVWSVPSERLEVPEHIGHAQCCAGVKRDGCEDGIDHFAAFPTAWPRRFVQGWVPKGGTVLDPFGGTGTTALVASAHGRIGITVDRSADYCRIAEWRTTDPAQRAKALGVDKPPVQLPGQAELFALAAA